MSQIIVIRHGETQWNRGEIFRGRHDIGLNKSGIRQAESLGNYLAELKLEAIYTSPLKRARDTADSVARNQGLNIRIAPELIDLDYGAWEGQSHQAVKNNYPELYRKWLKAPHRVDFPDGENLEGVRERAKSLLGRMPVKHTGKLALVSHRVVNKILICLMLGLDNSHFWDIKIDLGGITIFEHTNSRYRLIKHNDTAYLSQSERLMQNDF